MADLIENRITLEEYLKRTGQLRFELLMRMRRGQSIEKCSAVYYSLKEETYRFDYNFYTEWAVVTPQYEDAPSTGQRLLSKAEFNNKSRKHNLGFYDFVTLEQLIDWAGESQKTGKSRLTREKFMKYLDEGMKINWVDAVYTYPRSNGRIYVQLDITADREKFADEDYPEIGWGEEPIDKSSAADFSKGPNKEHLVMFGNYVFKNTNERGLMCYNSPSYLKTHCPDFFKMLQEHLTFFNNEKWKLQYSLNNLEFIKRDKSDKEGDYFFLVSHFLNIELGGREWTYLFSDSWIQKDRTETKFGLANRIYNLAKGINLEKFNENDIPSYISGDKYI